MDGQGAGELGIHGAPESVLARERAEARAAARDEEPLRREAELRRNFFTANVGRDESEWLAVRDEVIKADLIERTKRAEDAARQSQGQLYRNF